MVTHENGIIRKCVRGRLDRKFMEFDKIEIRIEGSARHRFLNPHGYPGMGVAGTGTGRNAHTRDI